MPVPSHGRTTRKEAVVFGDLTFVRKFQSRQSPGSCRTSQGSVIAGN